MLFQTTLQEMIASTSELAALPVTTVRLLELLDDPTCEARRVLTVIDKDPALTANLLKLCNSAYYGLRRQVGSVMEALVLLGNKTVVTLAYATSMGDVFRGQLLAYSMGTDDMWRHALAVALGGSYLMEALGRGDMKERGFTAGLMHDIGKLLLNKPLSKSLEQLPKGAIGTELMKAERQICGFDHCEAGAALATAWNFPPMLVTAIFHHHDPRGASSDTDLLRAVFGANLIAESVGLGSAGPRPVQEEDLVGLTDLGIPENAILHLVEHLSSEIQNLLSALQPAQSR